MVPMPLEGAGPQAARPAPGLTDGRQGAAVSAVEVGPGFDLTALAANQDPIAAVAGQQAHPDGAATLVAELEKGNPARGPCSRRLVPAPYATDPVPGLPHILCMGQRPEVLPRDVQHRPFRIENKHRAQMPPEGSDRAGQEAVGPSRVRISVSCWRNSSEQALTGLWVSRAHTLELCFSRKGSPSGQPTVCHPSPHPCTMVYGADAV